MKKLTITRDEAVALFVALGTSTAGKWNLGRLAAKASKVDEMIDDDVKLPKAEDATLSKLLKAIEGEIDIEVVEAEEEAPAPAKKGKTKAAPVEEAPKAKAKSKAKPTQAPVEEPVEEVVEEEVSPEVALANLKAQYDDGEITAAEFKEGRKAIVAKKTAASKPTKAAKPPKAEKPAKPVDFSKSKAAKPEKAAKAAPVVEDGQTRVPRVRSTETRPFLAGQIIKEYGLEVGVTDEMIAELDRRYGTNKPRECAHILRHAWHSVRGFLSE